MTIEAQNTKIDGVTYRCVMMPGWTSIELFWDLVNLLGEGVVVALTQAFQSDENMDKEVSDVAAKALGSAAYSMFGKLDAEAGTRLMKRALVGVQAEGVSTTDTGLLEEFDDHFRGRSWAAMLVFIWALKVNYRDFLEESGLLAMLPVAREAATKVSIRRTSPETSEASASSVSAAAPTA